MGRIERLLQEHGDITRRYFIKVGAAGAGAIGLSPLWAGEDEGESLLAEAVAKLEYLTREEDFINYGRGDPPPHTLPVEKKRQVGLCARRGNWRCWAIRKAMPRSNGRSRRRRARRWILRV